MEYKLTLTEEQMKILSVATDVFARLGIGQFQCALEYLPIKNGLLNETWHKDMEQIRDIISKYTIDHVDGYRSSLGIHSKKVKDIFKNSYDLHQVIRHKLSWDRAITEGLAKFEDDQQVKGNYTVDYDRPFQTSKQPLARVESI